MSQVRGPNRADQIALIAVGSNQASPWGGPLATVKAAIARVEIALDGQARVSGFYQTPAFPAGAGPDFVNAAFAVATDLAAGEVLAHLHAVEADAARTRDRRWGQRTLDLDLVALGAQVLPDRDHFLQWRDLPLEAQMETTPQELILPHPRMQDRAFVLRPLADVAADWRHPVTGLRVAEMLAARPRAEQDSVQPLI